MSTRDDYLISAYGQRGGDFALDTEILSVIDDGAVHFSDICAELGLDTRLPNKPSNDWRRVDRRLQWLRKNRFVLYVRGKGWKLLPPEKSAGAA